MMAEVAKSELLEPFDEQVDTIEIDADAIGVYGWLKDHFTDKGDSPPSIGWGNMQKHDFDETQANHPDQLGNVHWPDLIGNPDLAIEVTAYRLRDLTDFVKANASPSMRHAYRLEQLVAAGYNIGDNGLSDAMTRGELGTHGTTYAYYVTRKYLPVADQI